jgi:hypothetical protein
VLAGEADVVLDGIGALERCLFGAEIPASSLPAGSY